MPVGSSSRVVEGEAAKGGENGPRCTPHLTCDGVHEVSTTAAVKVEEPNVTLTSAAGGDGTMYVIGMLALEAAGTAVANQRQKSGRWPCRIGRLNSVGGQGASSGE